jgi:hypothetical protein
MLEATPVPERVRCELGAVVATNVLGRAATNGDQAVEDSDSRVRVDPSTALDR